MQGYNNNENENEMGMNTNEVNSSENQPDMVENNESQSSWQSTEYNIPDYNFWAEQNISTAQIENVTPDEPYTEASGADSGFSQAQYEAPKYNYYEQPVQDTSAKKTKKKHGFWKKTVKLVASAAVFGIVAGLCFQGVNYVAKRLNPKPEIATTTEPSSDKSVATTTVSENIKSQETDLTTLVDNTMPAIVSITSTMTQDFSYFGQNYQESYEGSGSGFIVGKNDDQLLVVTNNHVIEGAKAIAVTFIDETVVEAVVKGTDTSADLAVLAIDLADISEETSGKIKIATLGDSSQVKVGQMAIAIGNALGYGQSVTVGYISAKEREVEASGGTSLALLQTDAAINPGNSGGALLNINGEVIGINSVKYSDTSVEGMGYAIPISEATPIIDDLMNREILKDNEKGYLGISGKSITEDNNTYNMPLGIYVYDVAENGAAAEGGILRGDIIVKVNGISVETIEALAEKVNSIRVGTEIAITVMRNENGVYTEKELKVVLKNSDSLGELEDSTGVTDTTEATEQQKPGQQMPDQGQGGYGFGDGSSSLEEFFREFYQ